MNISIKIIAGNIKKLIISEFAGFNPMLNIMNSSDEPIILDFQVNLKLNIHEEFDYTIKENSEIMYKQGDNSFKIPSLYLNENLVDILDDLITAQIDKTDTNADLEPMEILKGKIESVFPIESLYYRIKLNEEKGVPFEKRVDFLYYIVSQSHKVKDMEIVKDFIVNFYSSQYSLIFTQYASLPLPLYEKALNDPDVSEEIKASIIDVIEKLPPVEDVLRTNNIIEIENYYFKMWKNNNLDREESAIVMAILNKGFLTERMMRDILKRYDEIFVLGHILAQRNCPLDIMLNACNYSQYHFILVENDFTPAIVISKLFNSCIHSNIMTPKGTIIDKIQKHRNFDNELNIKLIEKRRNFLNKIGGRIGIIRANSNNELNDIIEEINKIIESYNNDSLISDYRVYPNEITDCLNNIVQLCEKNNDLMLSDLEKNQILEDVRHILKKVSIIDEKISMLIKAKRNELDVNDITMITNYDNEWVGPILNEIKDPAQINQILSIELKKTQPLSNIKNAKLNLIKNRTDIDFLSNPVVKNYKQGFINYLNSLYENKEFDKLESLLQMLKNKNGEILDNTISLNSNDIDMLIDNVTDKTQTNILDNLLYLKKIV